MSEVFAGSELSLAGSNLSYVIVAAVIALVALGFAAGLVRTVLATGKGTQKMQDIAGAVQEGASAYLTRQFKTLGVFVIIAVVLLFLLPVNEGGFFFQAEDGIRDLTVTGVQTCALPICTRLHVRGLSLPLHGLVAYRNGIYRVQSMHAAPVERMLWPALWGRDEMLLSTGGRDRKSVV